MHAQPDYSVILRLFYWIDKNYDIQLTMAYSNKKVLLYIKWAPFIKYPNQCLKRFFTQGLDKNKTITSSELIFH